MPGTPFYEGADAPSQPDMDFEGIYAAKDDQYVYILIKTDAPLADGKERWLSVMFDAIPDPDPKNASVTGVNYRPTSKPWSTTGKATWLHGYDVDFCIFHNGPKTEAFFLRYKDGSGADWKGEGKTWRNAWSPKEGEDFVLHTEGFSGWELRIPRKELSTPENKGDVGILITCEGDAPDFIHEDFWPNDASNKETSFRYSVR